MGKKAVNCEICGTDISMGPLDKIRGTYITNGKKKYAVCPACQKAGESILAKEFAGKI